MFSLFSRVRQSLALRVLISTVLLSMGVIWLAGSALNTRLSEGIKKVNLESSLNEGRSTIEGARYRFLLVDDTKPGAVRKIVDEAINSGHAFASNSESREVVLLHTPGTKSHKVDYQTTSNFVDISSISQNLRKQVRNKADIQWEYTTIKYKVGVDVPAIAVGQLVSIPRAGQYELYLLFPLLNQNKSLDLISKSLLITGFALVFLIGLIIYLLTRQIIRPVREAARIAEGFTAGNLSQRMNIESKDEIAVLGNSFNEMAQSIQEQITRLENLSRVQQRFVSDVSHELRTPLTTLSMASEVIYTARDSFDPHVARSAELLVSNLMRFESLLEELLEISRFDAEVAVLEVTNFDLVQSVSRCIADLQIAAREVNAPITLSGHDAPTLISGDVRRVERILRNLLTNAIDHANQQPIEVTIAVSETDVAVGVRDFGDGMKESDALQVFDRFWRADPSRSREYGGTGLGLSIALEDARLHNGELEAWGRPGKGAHFVLTLPRVAGEQIQSRIISLKPSTTN